ncbi:MAG: hypothetical protein G01um101420_820 [Parcubacteria group bacterium Gr01-1014_20]|nr:MAG: hypothetical protein G01um101420_820 [Parcubacteria group bacterium Gr01-1014_20]
MLNLKRVKSIQRKYEIINFVTGLLLMISGLIELYGGNHISALSWIIFGSMYLIMDNYHPQSDNPIFFEKLTEITRKIFSWVGFLGSILLLTLFL